MLSSLFLWTLNGSNFGLVYIFTQSLISLLFMYQLHPVNTISQTRTLPLTLTLNIIIDWKAASLAYAIDATELCRAKLKDRGHTFLS